MIKIRIMFESFIGNKLDKSKVDCGIYRKLSFMIPIKVLILLVVTLKYRRFIKNLGLSRWQCIILYFLSNWYFVLISKLKATNILKMFLYEDVCLSQSIFMFVSELMPAHVYMCVSLFVIVCECVEEFL